MQDVKVCREHLSVKTNGYCLRCKAETEKRRYDTNPQRERDRKRKAYHAKKQQQRRLERINGQIMAITCEHEEAMAVPEEAMVHKYEDMIYNCPLCGLYFTSDGTTISDPTEGEPDSGQPFHPAKTQSKVGAASVSGTTTTRTSQGVSSGPLHNGNGPMRLGATKVAGDPKRTNETVQESVSDVSSEHSGGQQLLPSTSQADSQNNAKPRKAKTLPAAAVEASVLPGPWAGAACPNLKAHGCKGLLEPYHTLKSEAFGNSYFYLCPVDGVRVILDFKGVSDPERKQ